MKATRRQILQASAVAGAVPLLQAQVVNNVRPDLIYRPSELQPLIAAMQPVKVDLAPAKWIWLPTQRTLPNTFALFRKVLQLDAAPKRALVLLAADSRYRLTVNGERISWGPAPCDPRTLDVDPIDVSKHLKAGPNVIGVEVLFYGHGEGTWPGGKPGLLFHLAIEDAGGAKTEIVSDETWLCYLDRAHRPGQYKRWYLRSLQEDFDARLSPKGWTTVNWKPDSRWTKPALAECASDKPAGCRTDAHWCNDTIDRLNPAVSSLRLRQIPLAAETLIPPKGMTSTFTVRWKRAPEDWFDVRMADSFDIMRPGSVTQSGTDGWFIETLPASLGVVLTFEFPEQITGFPQFKIVAPEGTIVELLVQESHDANKSPWLDTHFFAWSRFTCRAGLNEFECFDYESLRFIQLHVRNFKEAVTISGVGVRRRQYAWAETPSIQVAEPGLQRLMNACVNTIQNAAIETIVDGMGRERQQYSGDIGHALHAIRYGFGDQAICRRYLRTWSQGQTMEGYFLDCWPASDRLARLAQKEMDGGYWGPLLDHGVGFGFDCWHHYLETGDRESVREPYTRMIRFVEYLVALKGQQELLPVTGLGMPTVWMDHSAYKKETHKQCSFNLYIVAMLKAALVPLADAFGDAAKSAQWSRFAAALLASTQKRFYSPTQAAFVDNLPWSAEEGGLRYSDRSLAMAILYGLNPKQSDTASIKLLVEQPSELGLSYPANAGWRMWALGKVGRMDIVTRELREQWSKQVSVVENNTLSEFASPRKDSTNEWSHIAVAPLYIAYMEWMGLRPTSPGFATAILRPQLSTLPRLAMQARTVSGTVNFLAEPSADGHLVEVAVPAAMRLDLEVGPGMVAEVSGSKMVAGSRVKLESGKTAKFSLRKA